MTNDPDSALTRITRRMRIGVRPWIRRLWGVQLTFHRHYPLVTNTSDSRQQSIHVLSTFFMETSPHIIAGRGAQLSTGRYKRVEVCEGQHCGTWRTYRLPPAVFRPGTAPDRDLTTSKRAEGYDTRVPYIDIGHPVVCFCQVMTSRAEQVSPARVVIAKVRLFVLKESTHFLLNTYFLSHKYYPSSNVASLRLTPVPGSEGAKTLRAKGKIVRIEPVRSGSKPARSRIKANQLGSIRIICTLVGMGPKCILHLPGDTNVQVYLVGTFQALSADPMAGSSPPALPLTWNRVLNKLLSQTCGMLTPARPTIHLNTTGVDRWITCLRAPGERPAGISTRCGCTISGMTRSPCRADVAAPPVVSGPGYSPVDPKLPRLANNNKFAVRIILNWSSPTVIRRGGDGLF
ncbi:hypothetical protein Bbelb_046160 [Branchiostoma belcheri]|nr:hypothetical protein Bbelb_046160 [Branchiostoma belcheri]